MINGSGTLSIRKTDIENQKIQSLGYVKTVAATKMSGGETGINLTSLTLPTELSSNGFSNPPTAQLQAANLLFYKNNLTIISSLRGLLQPYHSYTVATSTQINFVGFTALANEIFTIQIDYTSSTGLKVVDARPINATGTVAINTTDFNVGTPFKINQYSTSQVGAVMVFIDGVLQARNTGNSSTVLDANYYEVDAGGGLGTIIRLNTTDPVNTRNVMVISNGLLSERPDGSMMAVIESTQGQLNNMATYVAALAGQSTTTVLGAAPSNVDLKAFGDRVLTIEQNRARIDLSNTWTANQQFPGLTTGASVAAGYIGEYITNNQSWTPSGTWSATALQATLTAGRWLIWSSLLIVTGTGSPTLGITRFSIADNNSAGAGGLIGLGSNIHTTAASQQHYGMSQPAVVNLSGPQSYYGKAIQDTGTYGTSPSVSIYFFALRIA